MKARYKLNIDGSIVMLEVPAAIDCPAPHKKEKRRPAFPKDQLFKARAAITDSGESIAEWSRRNNLDLQITGHVLRGALKANRGEAFKVAVALGLRKRVAKKRAAYEGAAA